MDQLDRLYRTLVKTIRTSFPQYLTQPFEVAELYQTILPYRHHRRTLGFETNQDYEVALLELLAGERGYLLVDERMRDALRREIATPNPDPAVFRQFASSQISLAHDPLRQAEAMLDAEPHTVETPRVSGAMPGHQPSGAVSRPGVASGPSTAMGEPSHATTSMERPTGTGVTRPSAAVGAAGTPVEMPGDGGPAPVVERGVIPGPGESCRFCSGTLPAGRRIVFCPHCGQDLTVRHCLACGTELELGWRFCISCGRSATAS